MLSNTLPGLSLNTGNSSSQAEPSNITKNDTVHIHTMWYQPSPLPRVTSRDRHFREKLIAAYLGVTNGTRDLPPNVKAHLWTDRKSMHAFYMPVTRPDGSEIELPHSMLARAPLSVHLEGEIEALIDQVSDQELRAMFEELHNHPAGENIGLRSDLVRLLYGILYSENSKKTMDRRKGEINIHVDIDTLAAMNSKKAEKQQAEKQQGENHVAKLDGLQRAKLELQAMHKSLEGMKLPKKPAPLTKEEVTALARRRQRSWSVHAPVEKSAGAPVVIPDRLRQRGYMVGGVENDLIGMVPGHRQAVMVAKQTHHLLKTGNYNQALFPHQGIRSSYNLFDEPLQEYAKLFHALHSSMDVPESKTLSRRRVFDYVLLAERIRQIKPALQEKLDALTMTAEDEAQPERERDIAKMQIEALSSIYDAATMLVESFVNKSTYSPQRMTASRQMVIDFLKFSASVFGVVKQRAFTSSWKGGTLGSDESIEYDDPEYKVQEKLVFKDIKAMIRPHAVE